MGKKKVVNAPDITWKKRILKARHSPIRRLFFSFDLTIPSFVATHLVRHVHAQPFVRSQRNDRQEEYDRTKAPQDTLVHMIWDMNAEELITIANKRTCRLADPSTRYVVEKMCKLVAEKYPEFKYELVPMCVREHGCHEMFSCGWYNGLA